MFNLPTPEVLKQGNAFLTEASALVSEMFTRAYATTYFGEFLFALKKKLVFCRLLVLAA